MATSQPLDVDAILAGAQPDKLHLVPIALSLNPPEDDRPGFAEAVCLRLSAHAEPLVRANALMGFGHLARLLRRFNDADAVRAAMLAGLADPDSVISGQANAAAGDLRFFMDWLDMPE
jgi:hypothetical protein